MTDDLLGAPSAFFGAKLALALGFAALVAVLIGRSASNTSPVMDSQSRPLTAFFVLVAVLLFLVLESSTTQVPFALSLHASAHSETFPRADLEVTVNLDDYKRAVGPAPFPTRAFMITTKAAQANGRTAHAVEQVRRHLNITDIQFVIGRNDLPDNDFGCETATPLGCRMGLNLAMHQIWKAIALSGAPSFVLEDDVLFHDDTTTLLPLYWAQVPPDYEIVYFGSLPQWLLVSGPSTPPAEIVRFGTAPYALHCTALTPVSAARFAALYTQIFRSRGWRDEPGLPEISPSEVFGDLFLSSYGLRTSFDARKWVSFESTLALPAKFSGIAFRDKFKNTLKLEEEQGCKCDNEYSLPCRGYFPILCAGLAFQSLHCNNMTRMHSWVEHYKEDMHSVQVDI